MRARAEIGYLAIEQNFVSRDTLHSQKKSACGGPNIAKYPGKSARSGKSMRARTLNTTSPAATLRLTTISNTCRALVELPLVCCNKRYRSRFADVIKGTSPVFVDFSQIKGTGPVFADVIKGTGPVFVDFVH